MDEYINREAAIKKLDHFQSHLHTVEGTTAIGVAKTLIEEIPAADVRPVVRGEWKHVRWVRDDDEQEGGYWISRCSNCSMPYHKETPFCPHCGADMRVES